MNIVITGSSKGIGKAIAEMFASYGHQLFLCARNEVDLYKTVADLQTSYPAATVHGYAIDLSNKENCKAFANFVLGIATPDIVVNNTGQYAPGQIYDEQEDALPHMIETNLYSAYYLTKYLLPPMMERKTGHIINMCSIASINPYANGGSYSISKYALLGFSKNLRQELIPYTIKVSSIMPGAVYTSSWEGSGVSEERIMKATDVAELVYSISNLSFQACVEDVVLRPVMGDL
jgi:short-subunit dehydrogenase